MRDLSFDSPLMPEAREIPAEQLGNLVRGQLKNPRFSFQISSWGFEHNYLVLKNIQLSFTASEWSFKKSSFLEFRCTHPEGQWKFGNLSLSPDRLKDFRFFVNPDGTLSIEGDFESVLRDLLSPYFKEAALARSLFFRADCPANASSVLQGFLRAWLVDYPTKNPESFKKISSAVEEKLKSLSLDSVKVSDLIEKSLALLSGGQAKQRVELKVRRAFDPKVLRWIPKFGDLSFSVEESLSPAARELLQSGAPQSGIEILGNSKLLESVSQIALSNSSFFSKVTASGAPFMEVKTPLDLDSLSAVLPELSPYHGKNLKLLPRIIFEDCASHPRLPRLIPFVGPDGFGYLDIAWVANLELYQPENNQVLVKRTLSPFWIRTQFRNLLGDRLSLRFKNGGLYSESGFGNQPTNCSIEKGPAEFNLTLDWLLGSSALGKAVQDSLNKTIDLTSKTLKTRLRFLGQESEENRYLDAGYLTEAWVLQIQ